jgi:hypothetical protein
MKPALLLVMLAALAGCGGDDGTDSTPAKASSSATTAQSPTTTTPASVAPKPAERAEEAVARLAKAAQADDCSHPADLFPSDAKVGAGLCHHVLEGLAVALPPEVKTYGSGAVVQNADNGGSTLLALDNDRRFKFLVAFFNPHLPKAPAKNADEVMSRVVGAIRRDSCDDLLEFALGRGQKFCAQKPIRQLHAALDRAYTASPKALGGDGSFAFYGLRVKDDYFTIVFLAAKNGSYYFVTSQRA